ncbi:MAG: toprim domain-containing protein [Clostridia bacterium]
MAVKNTYNNESIKSLKGPDRVRKCAPVIFGSDGLEGCQHSVFEIVSNSVDEARAGHGNLIEVIRHADKSVTVKDYGRGMPVDFNKNEGRYNWDLIYCELYAGAKYDGNLSGNYKASIGLNGLGCCATQYASEYMDVEVIRDGFKYNLHFEEGYNKGGLKKKEDKSRKTGTTTRWKPDPTVFTDIDIPLEYFQDMLKRQAVANAGLKFTLKDEQSGQTFEYVYENGIRQYLEEVVADKNCTTPVFISEDTKLVEKDGSREHDARFTACFCFSSDMSLIEHYYNSSYLVNGGSPERAMRAAFAYALDKFITTEGKYTRGEAKITYTDIQDSLVFISNSFSSVGGFENQTKKCLVNSIFQDAFTEFLKHELEVYFIENKSEAVKIADQVLLNKRSAEQAEKTKLNLKKKLGKGLDMNNRVKKFVDCRSKDADKREIYIVEGDSALGSAKMGRDAEFQAIIPVRGKILNCLKAEYNRIFDSDIIIDLLKVLGCGVEIKTKANKKISQFDMKNLKWSKIIICTDADVDGFQIRTLILTMIYRLMPSLIDAGKVYIAESPLFEITHKKDTYFAYSEAEKNEIMEEIKGNEKKNGQSPRITIQRSKGLGENEPDMMWLTTMNPATRRLIKVMPTDVKDMDYMFDLLLGDNLQGRKDYIQEYGYKYTDMLDVS